MVQTT